MTEEDILKMLKDRLTIRVESRRSTGFSTAKHHLVQLLLDDDVISEDYLPDPRDD